MEYLSLNLLLSMLLLYCVCVCVCVCVCTGLYYIVGTGAPNVPIRIVKPEITYIHQPAVPSREMH